MLQLYLVGEEIWHHWNNMVHAECVEEKSNIKESRRLQRNITVALKKGYRNVVKMHK